MVAQRLGRCLVFENCLFASLRAVGGQGGLYNLVALDFSFESRSSVYGVLFPWWMESHLILSTPPTSMSANAFIKLHQCLASVEGIAHLFNCNFQLLEDTSIWQLQTAVATWRRWESPWERRRGGT